MDGDIIKTGLHCQQFFKVASEQQKKELASKYSSSEHLSKIILHCEDIKHLSKIFSEDFILKFLQENTSVMSRCINKVMSSPFICEGENVFFKHFRLLLGPQKSSVPRGGLGKSSDWKEEYTVGLPIDLQNYLHNTAAMMTYGEIWSAAIHTYHLDMEKTHDSCCKIGSLPIGVLTKISLFSFASTRRLS